MLGYVFNIVLLGSSRTGKTSFMRRYTQDIFNEQYRGTYGPDFEIKNILALNSSTGIRMMLLDTSTDPTYVEKLFENHGFACFSQIVVIRGIDAVKSCYRGAQGFFILFDVTDRESFNQVPSFLKNIEDWATCATNKIQIILIATKIDLAVQRQVSYEEAKQLADQLGIKYIETSAKDNININEAFQRIAVDIEEHWTFSNEPSPTHSSNLRCNII